MNQITWTVYLGIEVKRIDFYSTEVSSIKECTSCKKQFDQFKFCPNCGEGLISTDCNPSKPFLDWLLKNKFDPPYDEYDLIDLLEGNGYIFNLHPNQEFFILGVNCGDYKADGNFPPNIIAKQLNENFRDQLNRHALEVKKLSTIFGIVGDIKIYLQYSTEE